ncbi:hypothetical protein [Pedobacter montanisoli]|uniref:Seryl-tRNA synthetase n=1 Tax=Pedobacter montanisoli TaxID=2923277 RepID=A0ABS9ZTD0_9SPHI|nr:hypothetical protein [Pedobacter montanisoli]MCJ0741204.1 hypothetical protein [Pedobacter montanisoli]
MKKLIYSLILMMTLSLTVNTVFASDKPKVNTELSTEQKAELERITSRVAEIKAMDKSNLSKDERKALRKELKEMKKKAAAMSGGVYLSVGAIIIIILLLILIL